jgi:hypothetical protein
MAATATPLQITPPRAAQLPRPRKGRQVVTLHLRLADLEGRDWPDEQLGRVVRAVGLAKAYGTISPAMLAMRTGEPLEDAQELLDLIVASGALSAAQVTGSVL